MIKLFSRKNKVNIDSVQIPDFGWQLIKSDATIKQWVNAEQTTALSINYFNAKPDIPTLTNLHALRFFYRDQLSKQNGGIILVDTLTLGDFTAVQTIFKVKIEEKKLIYLGSLTIPFQNCSYVIKIQAAEVGTTGVRESVIGMKLLNEGKISVDENGYVGWNQDPYEPNFTTGELMNISEKGLYDLEFPNHPLTETRSMLRKLINEVSFDDEVGNLKKYKG